MSKFVVWIDAPTDNNTITYEELEKLKVNGFVPNNIISSNEVNSIIRQSNLVACALMNLTGDNTLNHRSSVQDIQNVLGSHFATNINNFTMATTRSNIEPSDTLLIQLGKISKYFNDLGSLAYKSEVDTSDFKSTAVSPNAKNVNTTINGKKISDIFESDGITVKKAKGSIKNSDGTYSSLINNSNNILKVDDTLIIEKKEELLAAPVTINRSSEYQTVNLTKSINIGDVIEVEVRSAGTGADNFNGRYRFIYRTLSTSNPYKYDFNSFYFVGNEADGIRFQYFSIKTYGEKAMQFHSIVQNTLTVQNEKAYLSPDLFGYSYTVQHIYRIIS